MPATILLGDHKNVVGYYEKQLELHQKLIASYQETEGIKDRMIESLENEVRILKELVGEYRKLVEKYEEYPLSGLI